MSFNWTDYDITTGTRFQFAMFNLYKAMSAIRAKMIEICTDRGIAQTYVPEAVTFFNGWTSEWFFKFNAQMDIMFAPCGIYNEEFALALIGHTSVGRYSASSTKEWFNQQYLLLNLLAMDTVAINAISVYESYQTVDLPFMTPDATVSYNSCVDYMHGYSPIYWNSQILPPGQRAYIQQHLRVQYNWPDVGKYYGYNLTWRDINCNISGFDAGFSGKVYYAIIGSLSTVDSLMSSLGISPTEAQKAAMCSSVGCIYLGSDIVLVQSGTVEVPLASGILDVKADRYNTHEMDRYSPTYTVPNIGVHNYTLYYTYFQIDTLTATAYYYIT